MGLLNTPLNKFGLSANSMSIISNIYKKYPQIEKVILYGSRAKGNYREGSDIDMTIISDGEFTHNDLTHVINDFDDSMLPYLTDISIFSELQNPDLIDHIQRRGKVLYSREKQ